MRRMNNLQKFLIWTVGIITTSSLVVSMSGSPNPLPNITDTPATIISNTASPQAIQTLPNTADISAPIISNTASPQAIQTLPNLSNNNYYINSDGNSVHSPAYAPSIPIGASAKCRDGTYSFSQHRQGTCSHHGGVGTWY